MYYVYVLLSLKDGKYYTGCTNNLKRRLGQHNTGKNQSTSFRRPFILVYYEASLYKEDALNREVYLKTSWGKSYLNKRMKYYNNAKTKSNGSIGGSVRKKGTPFDAVGYQTGGDNNE